MSDHVRESAREVPSESKWWMFSYAGIALGAITVLYGLGADAVAHIARGVPLPEFDAAWLWQNFGPTSPCFLLTVAGLALTQLGWRLTGGRRTSRAH